MLIIKFSSGNVKNNCQKRQVCAVGLRIVLKHSLLFKTEVFLGPKINCGLYSSKKKLHFNTLTKKITIVAGIRYNIVEKTCIHSGPEKLKKSSPKTR